MRRLALALVAALSAFAAAPALAATRWQVDPAPEPAGGDFTGLNGTFVASPTQAWAVGIQRQSSSLDFTALIDSWNGSTWHLVLQRLLQDQPGAQPADRLYWILPLADTGQRFIKLSAKTLARGYLLHAGVPPMLRRFRSKRRLRPLLQFPGF